MDFNQFRKHLKSAQPKSLTESTTKNLAYEIQNAHKSPSLRKMAERVESVLGHVLSMASNDPFTFTRRTPHLISRLETLMRMLYDGVHVGVDPSEVEILQKEIVADIKKH
jgi:hypothetical protein